MCDDHEPGQPDIIDRVQAGVRLLDDKVPGWYGRVDVDTLDMAWSWLCVLGQVFTGRSGNKGDGPYVHGLRFLNVTRADLYGFDADPCEYAALDAAWESIIVARQLRAARATQ
jgi:hypothetical protein